MTQNQTTQLFCDFMCVFKLNSLEQFKRVFEVLRN